MTDNFKHLDNCFLAHGVPEEYLTCWFSNYDCKSDQQKKALETIEAAYKDRKPMIFIGNFGGGKTHLATAMVKSHLYYGLEARYYTLTSLFREYRFSLKAKEFDDLNEVKFFKRVTDCDLIVIDEFNIRSDSEAECRMLQEIMDMRYSSGKPTIIVSNSNWDKVAAILTPRIVDRLKGQGAVSVIFDWESGR